MDEDPRFTYEDWRHEVREGNTDLGYEEWVLHQREDYEHDVEMGHEKPEGR